MSLSAEENYRLLCEIEANRAMLLQAYRQNAHLLAHAEERIRRIFNHGATGQAMMENHDGEQALPNS